MSRPGVYRRLLGLARPFWPHIGGLFLIQLAATPLAILAPLPIKLVVDCVLGERPLPGAVAAVVPAGSFESSDALLGLAVGLLLGVALLTQLQAMGASLMSTWVGQRMVLDFRARLFRRAQRLSLAYHDARGAADTYYRIFNDAPAIQHVAIQGLLPFLTAAITIGGMLSVTVLISPSLALVALGVCPIIILASNLLRRGLRARWRNVHTLESEASSVVHQALGALRVVKAFGKEAHEENRFVKRSARGVRAQVRVILLEGGFGVAMGLTVAVGTAAVLVVGVRQVQVGAITLGDLLLVIAYLGQLYGPLKTIGKKIATLQRSLASAERAFVLLDEAAEVPERPDARPLVRARGAIEFRGVDFAYGPDARVLHDVSFAVPAGARVGISGQTGAGKTTLTCLLMRFYDPTGGSISLDGVDLRDYRIADLRDQFSVVLQEPVLFATTVAENIRYARPEATEAEIEAAARAANAHDFISRMPQAYDTPVGERGMRLSGGERQRLSLARAFLKDAPVLILDEPTSSVDVDTEAEILDALERLVRERTTFTIAHRAATLEACDVRLELDRGRLRVAGADAPRGFPNTAGAGG